MIYHHDDIDDDHGDGNHDDDHGGDDHDDDDGGGDKTKNDNFLETRW